MHFGVAFIKFLCFICDRAPIRSFSGQIKWEIGLTFNQNISLEEKRGFAYIVLILSVKTHLHPLVLAHGFEILNYREVCFSSICFLYESLLLQFPTSPIDTCEKFSFVSSSFLCDHWGGWRSHASLLK